MKSELKDRLTEEAYKHGAEACWVEQHRKHRKLRIQLHGKTLTYVLATSGSDWREAENALSGLRNVMGVRRKVTKSAKSRTKSRTRRRPAAIELAKPNAPPMKDPFATLAALRDRLGVAGDLEL